MANLDKLQIHVRDQVLTLDELLPHAFGNARAKGHSLLDSCPVDFEAVSPEPNTSQQHAINAAQRSYVPYTRSREGFAIECANGQSFSGRAVECAAFNPSVPGFLTALNQRNLSNSRDVAISACTQAKLATAINDPLPCARAVMGAISNVKIDVVQMEAQ